MLQWGYSGLGQSIGSRYHDIFTAVSSDPSYSIFAEGLSLTGLKDTLQIITFPYGNKVARTRFTLLAVADTIYQRYGINKC